VIVPREGDEAGNRRSVTRGERRAPPGGSICVDLPWFSGTSAWLDLEKHRPPRCGEILLQVANPSTRRKCTVPAMSPTTSVLLSGVTARELRPVSRRRSTTGAPLSRSQSLIV
jgi:hypothetical protein